MSIRIPDVASAQHVDIPLSSNHDVASPLRYPGGKSVLSGFVQTLMSASGLEGGTYVEPYAGGAGIALRLLRDGIASRIVINDLDPDVYAFWDSAVNHPDGFLRRFDAVEPTIDEWKRQRRIIRESDAPLDRGFAFFFLNRTNRSGVADGGVIGGLRQEGRYKVWARYNKSKLRDKLVFLANHGQDIDVLNMDGMEAASEYLSRKKTFVYIDPPYVDKGSSLYLNALTEQQHRDLAGTLERNRAAAWMLTYDDTRLTRELYTGFPGGLFPLRYSAASHRQATELAVFSDTTSQALQKVMERRETDNGTETGPLGMERAANRANPA